MATRTAGYDDSLLQLVRDEAEAAPCGIPRVALEATSDAEHVVCPECIDWLP